MYCSNCGKEIEKNKRYCMNCGEKVKEEKSNKKKQETPIFKSNLIVLIIFIILLLTIISIICISIMDKNRAHSLQENKIINIKKMKSRVYNYGLS